MWLLLMPFVLQEEKVFQAYDQISPATYAFQYSQTHIQNII